ncbi:hypothetical protein [uncultured Dysgonomonas sp.]|uniref:Uncharacterized protein n=1 Tax=uncultured Dysgonomonas sp. TaxID=206096 RepID=A0A212K309_9BACT|nr:hypothetical protein [uncultured Dysgonomonas sp.]SBW06063.1 conserved hypothetical protein [uncultured Dysgonomonas sp.]
MASLELYINNQLCEIEDPENFSVYLKRQLLNPAELSTKDAQRSYDISLPATATNNAIFGYTNTEEVKGKFSQLYNAQLLVNGIKIFDGKFKVSEIGKDYYKGNLGIPAAKTVKDIFGEMKMNQAGKWLIPFKGTEDITNYNTGQYDENLFKEGAPCIFPLVLYGLFPRDENIDKSPDRLQFDKNVKLTKDDIPPSVNCLQMLKRIFANANYKLTGTAMNDERLKNLYVSYKNKEDYKMPWSVSPMSIKGQWNNYISSASDLDWDIHGEFPLNESLFTAKVNLFGCYNISILEYMDEEGNINVIKPENSNSKRTNVKFKIPRNGLYKVEFDATLTMGNGYFRDTNSWLGINSGSLFDGKYELKLVRNYMSDDDYKYDKFDNVFYKDNIEQERGKGNSTDFIFPQGENVNFIDPKQNPKFICGFSWGKYDKDAMADYYNPYNLNGIRANSMAISGGESWEKETRNRFYSAAKSPGYRNANGTVSRFKVDIDNIPYPKMEYFPSSSDLTTDKATGKISQIIWLEEGDSLSIVDLSHAYKSSYDGRPVFIWPNHYIDFSLSVTPFQESWQWLTIDESGASDPGKSIMDWNANSTISENEIDLMKYLPADVKVNDWVDNFCKAFNLKMINAGDNNFELNVKPNEIVRNTLNVIDLDKRANVRQGANESLKLPNTYELGFTVETSEEGYYDSITEYVVNEFGYLTDEKVLTAGDNGGGRHSTGSYETTIINQISNFSYNWFKEIKNEESKTILLLPVITNKEVWERGYNYYEMANKNYTNLAQRFWFQSGSFVTDTLESKGSVALATVSEKYDGEKKLILNYKDEPESIAHNYFLLMTNNENNYTVANCHLTPSEYANIDKCLVKLNGDLYNVAEVDGYDPLEKKQCKLKLIRVIY